MVKQKKNKVGAPSKKDAEKKDPNTGLTGEQSAWLKNESDTRNIPQTEIIREAFSMYMTAVESQRGDETVQELFKDIYLNTNKNKNK